MPNYQRAILSLLALLCAGLATIGCGGGEGGDAPEGPALYMVADDGIHGCEGEVVREAACGERIWVCGVGLTPDEVLVIEREAGGERSEVTPVETTREDSQYSDPGVFGHVADDILPADCTPGESYRILVTDPQAGEVATTITAS